MPVIIKDYLWKQTPNNIMLQVSLRGVHQSKADIIISPRYVKVLYQQNIFEVILRHPIDVNSSKCTLTEEEIIFDLKKETDAEWDFLEPQLPKVEKQVLKKQLLEQEYERTKKEMDDKRNEKSELKRVAVREQIEIDTKNRQLIEEIKKKEEKNALGNVDVWANNISQKRLPKAKKETKKKSPVLEKEVIPTTQLSALRSTRTLQVDFTPREFPTPCRESRLEEENEWLKKQVEARRATGFVSEDVRPEEKNPMFLKSKGDEFLKNKNYLGAISAFSFGIKLAPCYLDLYIARSEAHLSLGNFKKTIEDCSAAVDLLKPELPINLKERALCIGRRGEALCKFGLLRQGIEELRASLKLLENEHFAKVLEKAEDDILDMDDE